jgi:hypothetical protein
MNVRAIGLSGLVMGLLFKLLHWPGASVLFLGSALITLVAFALLLVRKRGPWDLRIHRPGALFASLTTVFAGATFKTMHWPGANLLLLVGLTGFAGWILAQSFPARVQEG